MNRSQNAITYRPALASDEAAIKALIRAVNINPMGLKWPCFLVAVDENAQLIGCGQIKTHRDGSRELASIAVQKAWRRQGIAGAIIKQLLARQEPPIWLTCTDNLVSFYEQFDFVEVRNGRTIPFYFRLARSLFKPVLWFSSRYNYLAIMIWPAN